MAWDALWLTVANYSIEQIRSCDKIRVFYRSSYVATPSVMQKLVAFMSYAMDLVVLNKTLALLFAADPRYDRSKKDIAQKIWEKDQYEMHPFIFERVPSCFFHIHGYKVLTKDV